MSHSNNAVGAVQHAKTLVVTVVSASELRHEGEGFCELIVRNRGTVKQTSTKSKGTSHEWDETFEFDIVDTDNDVLDVKLYNYHGTLKNTLLGHVTVPVLAVRVGGGIDHSWHLLEEHAHTVDRNEMAHGKLHLKIKFVADEHHHHRA